MRRVLGDKCVGDGESWERVAERWMGGACLKRLYGEQGKEAGYELVADRFFNGVALSKGN